MRFGRIGARAVREKGLFLQLALGTEKVQKVAPGQAHERDHRRTVPGGQQADGNRAAVDADIGRLGSGGHFAPDHFFLFFAFVSGGGSDPDGAARQRGRGEEKQGEPLGSMEDSVHVEHI